MLQDIRILLRLQLLLAVSVLLTACESLQLRASPNPLTSMYKSYAEHQQKKYEAEANRHGGPFANVTKMEKRNQIIRDFMLFIDVDYDRYERALTRGQRDVRFAKDLATSGLGLIAGVSGGGTPQILGFITSALTGVKTLVDRDYYNALSMTAIVKQMRQSREDVRKLLVNGMKEPMDRYPMVKAIEDLNEYYRASTVTEALQDIADAPAAGKPEKAEEAKKAAGK